MTNLFALMETKSEKMLKHPDPHGVKQTNDEYILFSGCNEVVAAWGTKGGHMDRDKEVLTLLAQNGRRVLCLDYNDDGSPKHPLYVAKTEPLKPYPKPDVAQG